jgi:hypothetical protein
MDATDFASAKHARYRELDQADCWELIRSAPIGRLVWHGTEGLSVATLNFTVDRQSILFRTLAYGSIARECDDSPVAFHVDHADATTRTGWSVLIRGRAHVEYGDTVAIDTIDAWPEGSRLLAVRVDPTRISGRRLTTA